MIGIMDVKRSVRFVGDVHGKYRQYKRLLEPGKESIQVGDMGVGFFKWPHGDACVNPPYDAMTAGKHRFIRGNHDNPNVCRNHTQWIPDGTVEGDMMFVGGADSIDKAMRIEGYSWWSDEELSFAALNAITDVYIATKPRIMVTHDAPQEVAEALYSSIKLPSSHSLEPTRTRQALQSMWSAHSPEIWIFGHWHMSFDHVLRGTRFICLAELEHKDLEV